MPIRADETIIEGGVVVRDGHVENDAAADRIARLVTDELRKLGHDASGWDTLYVDPADGRYWERVYLRSAMHGGGPATLRCVPLEELEDKYPECHGAVRDRTLVEIDRPEAVMMLRPDEHEITGGWIFDGRRVVGDPACERIEHLLAHVLECLGPSIEFGAWDMLYRDPADRRLWERTYPQSHRQGGGPPRLAVISRDDAVRKYGSFV